MPQIWANLKLPSQIAKDTQNYSFSEKPCRCIPYCLFQQFLKNIFSGLFRNLFKAFLESFGKLFRNYYDLENIFKFLFEGLYMTKTFDRFIWNILMLIVLFKFMPKITLFQICFLLQTCRQTDVHMGFL